MWPYNVWNVYVFNMSDNALKQPEAEGITAMVVTRSCT